MKSILLLSFSPLLAMAETIVTLDTALNNCPPLGPVLPPPQSPSTNAAVQNISAGIEALQSSASLLFGNATAISIVVASVYEDLAAPMAAVSYTPDEFNTTGTHTVDGDTVFRIGSVSKLFTVLGLLVLEKEHRGVHLGDPVTKYVPELVRLDEQTEKDFPIAVDWDDITLEALASQLSGIGGDMGHDLANEPGVDFTPYGLPAVSAGEHTECGELLTQRPCTWRDFFSHFGKRSPVYAPFTTPDYSNMGYDLLGLVIERISHRSYGDFIQEKILEPLNMTHTFVTKPANDSLGFIPSSPGWWGTSYGFLQADGGLYSSNNDLLKFGRGILTNALLPASATRKWLKPHTHTSSLGISVGMPWEIGRSNNLTEDGRLVDVYSKTGDIGDYNALFALIPDYGLVFSALSSGPLSSTTTQLGLATEILEPLVRAVEAAGKEEVTAAFAGTYTAGHGTANSSSITLAVDDQAGLNVTSWTMNGLDVFELYPAIVGLVPTTESASSSDTSYLSIRLYPSTVGNSRLSSWRAVYTTTPPEDVTEADQLFILQAGCQSWSGVDSLVYGLRALDDFAFELDPSTGKATGITPRAFRQTLSKVKSGKV